MSEKRYKRFYVSESENQLTIYDNEGLDDYYHLGNDERDVKGICKLLNEQQDTISQLRTQLLICQQSKKDDGRFQVWEVPPIPKGTRITFSTTTERSDKNE